MGIGGSYLAFGGLWAVPWLEHAYGMPRVTAAQHTSALLLGVAFGALAIGMLSDRLGSRRDGDARRGAALCRVLAPAAAARRLAGAGHASPGSC